MVSHSAQMLPQSCCLILILFGASIFPKPFSCISFSTQSYMDNVKKSWNHPNPPGERHFFYMIKHLLEQGGKIYNVACQRGAVSNKHTLGSGQPQDTGPGILWSVHRWTRPTGEPPITYTKILKRNEPHIWFAFFTKTGWAWHVTIN